MLHQENILSFVNYHYRELSIKYLMYSNLTIWLISAFIWITDGKIAVMNIFLLCANIGYMVLCVIIVIRGIKKKTSKLLIEGTLFTYLSVQIILLSYKIFTFANGRNTRWFILLTCSWIFSIIIAFLFVKYNIKKNNYSKKNPDSETKNIIPFSIIGGVFGVTLCRVLSKFISGNFIIILCSVALIFLSFLFSIGSMSFLKYYYLKKLELI
ncbi:MAG: hypothetical protein ACOYKJ_05655 [Candidatus Howiella sp.]|jgi:hypothetical protein